MQWKEYLLGRKLVTEQSYSCGQAGNRRYRWDTAFEPPSGSMVSRSTSCISFRFRKGRVRFFRPLAGRV